MRKLILITLVGTLFAADQVRIPGPGGVGAVSGGSVTIGLTTNSGNDGGGDSATAIYQPIVTPSGGSGYTLSAFHVVTGASAGNLRTAIYGKTNSGCPTNIDACPGTLICQSSSAAATTGDQTLNPASCGTLAASTMYFLATNTDNATTSYNHRGTTGLRCPANGWGLQFKALTFGAFPGTAATGNSAQHDCFEVYVVLTCVGTCGSTVPNYTVLDGFSGGTATNTPTVATMNSSTHCRNGVWAIGNAGALTNMTYQSSPSPQAFVNSALTPCNATTYTGTAGGLVIKRITGANDQFPNDALNYGPDDAAGGFGAGYSTGVWIQTDTAQNLTNGALCDVFGITTGSTGNTLQFVGNGGTNLMWRMEHVVPSRTTDGPNFSTSTWYWAVLDQNAGTIRTAIYDTTGSQVGSTITDSGTVDNNPVNLISFGNQGSCFSSPVNNIYYAGMKFDPSDSFPVLADRYPDAPWEIGPVNAQLVRDGIIHQATIRDGKWFSYALNRTLD